VAYFVHKQAAGLLALCSMAIGCAASATVPDARSNASVRTPLPAQLEAIVRVTEADPTVSTSLAPLVEAAGPATLFVPSASVRCPHEMTLVGDRVCVDRWEASIVLVAAAGEQQHSPFQSLDEVTRSYRAVSRPGVVPQGYVSGVQAERACRAAGKRLCTANEWERGCRGPAGTQFPYGSQRQAKTCNDDIRALHPVVEATRLSGVRNEDAWTDGMNLPLINQLPDSLAKTGEREQCVSSEGLHDMVGNLHEWVADADGTFRGGYYMDTTRNGDGCSYRTTAHEFGYHDYSTGFRCCADPETIE
jgi:hypothetical protein